MIPASETVFENDPISIPASGAGGKRVYGGSGRMHARISASFPSGAATYQNGTLRIRGYCGLLDVNGKTVEILPKTTRGEPNAPASRNLLLRMLSQVRGFPLRSAGDVKASSQPHYLLDLFADRFAHQAFTVIQGGLARAYETVSSDLYTLRGRFDLDRQLCHNIGHKERLACTYQDHTENILLNQIIKSAASILRKRVLSASTQQRLITLQSLLDHIDAKVLAPQDVDRVKLDRRTERYRTLLNACRSILALEWPDFRLGASLTMGLLVNMERLFEQYALSSVKRVLPSGGSYCLARQSSWLARSGSDGANCLSMTPDGIILDGETGPARAVVDAKWKPTSQESAAWGVSSGDIYQMYVYAHEWNCRQAILVYPGDPGSPSSRLDLQLQRRDLRVSLITLGHDSAALQEILPEI